jgi:2-oxoglutarate ferredoxin oxidoreductase subunit alpha
MAEAMSYMAGSQLPCVLVNVMRGGPGLGSIGAAQGDYLQATKGHGHGDYHVPVLAPSSIAEAIEIVGDAFVLAERYRTPVIILAYGILGQAMEPVRPDFPTLDRQAPDWHIEGAQGREPRSLRSLNLRAEDLERHNLDLQAIYAEITEREPRWAGEHLQDAEVVLVAYGTAARVARTAVERAREHGLKAGLFRPITLWPFPATALRNAAGRARAVLVVELSAGQLVEDVRLTLDGTVRVMLLGRMGGMVPSPDEVVEAARQAWSGTGPAVSIGPSAKPQGGGR